MIFPLWHDSKITARETLFFSLALLLFIAGRLYLALGMPIHPDEAYYWAWSTRLDWAYYDQGPAVAWYIKLFTTLFGDNYFALKLAALVPLFPVLYWTYSSARELGLGPHRSALAVLGLALCPGVFGGSGLIMHDTVLLLFWVLALWAMIRYLIRRKPVWLYLMFLALGLGALSKHTMALFALSLVFWYFTQRQEYYLLRYRHFWGGLLWTLLCLIPLILWNVEHNWDQIGAILYLRSSGGAMAKGSPALMLAGQMGLMSPLWFLSFVALIFFIVWKLIRRISLIRYKPDTRELSFWDSLLVTERSLRLRILNWVFEGRLRPSDLGDPKAEHELNRRSAFWLIFWNAVFLPLFFLLLSKKRIIQANWVLPSYPAVFILLAAYVPVGKGSAVLVRRWTRKLYMVGLGTGLLFAIFINLYALHGLSLMKALGVQVPAYAILEYRTRGYEEIVNQIKKLRKKTDPSAYIIANRYQDAAIAHWYLKNSEKDLKGAPKNSPFRGSFHIRRRPMQDASILLSTLRRLLPSARHDGQSPSCSATIFGGALKQNSRQKFVSSMNISQKNQYSYWPSLEKGKNYIVFSIVENPADSVDRGFMIWAPYMFESVREFPEKIVYFKGMPVKRYRVWYVKNFRVEWYEVLKIYLDRIAILDLMPSMRGFDKYLKAQGAQKTLAKFMAKKRLSQACRNKDIWERLFEAFTGSSARCQTGGF